MADRVLLYVEDEDAAVYLLETALKEANIQLNLYRVADGEQALAFMNRSGPYQQVPKPDLVLLDLNLPRKGGLEVLSEMQESETLRQLPVIVFTSSLLAADRKKSLALGAQHYITKPSSFGGLVEAVKTACSYLPA
jgi:CheY-like chemotaxis protein